MPEHDRSAPHTHGLHTHGPAHVDCVQLGWLCTACRLSVRSQHLQAVPATCSNCGSVLLTAMWGAPL